MKNHEKAQELYYAKDPEKLLLHMVATTIHDCIKENYKSINELFGEMINEVIQDNPESIICLMEAFYEACLQEKLFITEHLLADEKYLQAVDDGDKKLLDRDILFEDFFIELGNCAKKFNRISVVHMMMEYYNNPDGNCV